MIQWSYDENPFLEFLDRGRGSSFAIWYPFCSLKSQIKFVKS